jgi:hypothetical protein
MDESNPEDVDTDQEDHCYDDVRYGCVSRPWMNAPVRKEKKPDRWMRAFEEQDDEDSWKVI